MKRSRYRIISITIQTAHRPKHNRMQQCQQESMKTTYRRQRYVFIVAEVKWHGENQENDAQQRLDYAQMKQKYVAG